MITTGMIIVLIICAIIMAGVTWFLIRDMNQTTKAILEWAKTVPKEYWEEEWKRNNAK